MRKIRDLPLLAREIVRQIRPHKIPPPSEFTRLTPRFPEIWTAPQDWHLIWSDSISPSRSRGCPTFSLNNIDVWSRKQGSRSLRGVDHLGISWSYVRCLVSRYCSTTASFHTPAGSLPTQSSSLSSASQDALRSASLTMLSQTQRPLQCSVMVYSRIRLCVPTHRITRSRSLTSQFGSRKNPQWSYHGSGFQWVTWAGFNNEK